MSRGYRPILICIAVIGGLTNAAQAVDFGRTSGSFDVTQGAATYTIPIWTPPGPNGVTPSIALTYSSSSGNGVGGVGWQLPVSSIERCAKTIGQDGGGAAVALTMGDRFCIDGKRLRLSSGTYGAAGSVYLTEIADYSRITAFGVGPEYFIVEARDGLLYQYGFTTNSRVYPGVAPLISTVPYRWMLNKVYDRNGNNYIISYNNLNGFAVPDVISWTPASHGSSTYRYEAKFNYFTSRSNADSILGKVAGFDVANRYRLENIQIKSGGVVKRKYRFTYNTSSLTSRSRLSSAKECADDAESNCFLPITFTYQAGLGGLTAGAGTAPPGSSNLVVHGRYDFNGDGKDDILYKNGSTWYAAFGSDNGFGGPYSSGSTASTVFVDRFLPNGRDAIAAVVSGVLWVYRWNDASSSFVAYNTGLSGVTVYGSADYDGDGLADLYHYISSPIQIHVRRNTSSPASSDPSFASTTLVGGGPGGSAAIQALWSYGGTGLQRADVNGDGRQDIFALIASPPGTPPPHYVAVLLGSSTGYFVPSSGSWLSVPASNPPKFPTMNFNGDRCTDRFYGTTIYISQCSGSSATTIVAPAAPLQVLDWDGDGKTDILVNNGGMFGVYLSTGTGFSSLIATSISSSGTFFTLDQDGDGFDDLIKNNGTSAISYWTHTSSGYIPSDFATTVPDLLASVTDGFGVGHSVSYSWTSRAAYASAGAATVYPLRVSEPFNVVAQVSSSNGIGGTFNRTFYYVGPRDNYIRNEFAGFQRIDVTDSRNGLISRSYFEQFFPVAGMLSQQELMQPNGTTPISRIVFTNGSTLLDSTANNQRYFTYPQASTATQYEVGGAWNSALLRTVTTSSSFDNTSGALYDQTVTTTEPASGANGVTAGGSWTARTYWSNLINDTTNWCLGRPGRTQQSNSHNLTYGGIVTRTRDITWNTTACRPTQLVDEPGDANLQITTAVAYDNFGNVSSTTVTGVGMSPRTTSTVYSDATYTTGQFPLSVTNALSQTMTSVWNYDLGAPTSATDANGLVTSWQYDAFGRRIREDRADSTATTWTIENCSAVTGTCINGTGITERLFNSASQQVKTSHLVLDVFDRGIMSADQLPADHVRVDREFDALGRVYRESAPFFWSTWIRYWTTNTYDLAGRPIQVSRPISDSNSTIQHLYLYYEGLSTRIVDGQGKQSIKVANAAGELARSTDHDGYYQAFDYDAFGAPKRVQDSLGNTLQSSTYNVRGMLTARTDMDMGAWSFMPNALGETVTQVDSRSNSTHYNYDVLGRLTSRTIGAETSTWTWGASSSAKNIGRLASVSGPGYSESYSYDSLGRPSFTTISADTTYQIDYTYNNIGALDTLTYPTSTSSYRLKLQYDYQYGQLYRIGDFNAPSTHFWTANAANPRNQITQETLGNGLVTNRSYDAVTGWLKSIQTGLSGGSGVQNLTYEWDLLGNLKQRRDVSQSNLTETFFYDNLYRLDYSQLNGVTNLDLAYDAMGNITSKSDVGAYTYHSTNKHQVTSTSNGWSFSYDNTGNMTSGRGATITWTDFNYPASITNGSDTSSFSYTPDRRYWRQISNYTSGGSATTIYVGGLLEKVTTSAGTDYRHVIHAGGSAIIVSRQSSGANSVHYVTRDHLGSSSAITNSAGGVVVNSSFDAFGKRRGANWSGSPSPGDWAAIASTTRRGYTDHTMLDNLGLIHMNGRVQDPVLGRFVSADPYVYDAMNSQSFNRYSYVLNSPLSYSDPSGFHPDELVVAELERVPGVTVTGRRPPLAPIDDEGASRSEQRQGPCQFFGGGVLLPEVCLQVNAQNGMGLATAMAMAERHRQEQPMQEVVVTAVRVNPASRPNHRRAILGDRGLGFVALLPGHGFLDCAWGASGCSASGWIFSGADAIPGGGAAVKVSAGVLVGISKAAARGSTRMVQGGATTAEIALGNAQRWLGSGYREIAPGVFRSADNLRQFRMTVDDLLDPKQGPHVHFEAIGPDGRHIIENAHVLLRP